MFLYMWPAAGRRRGNCPRKARLKQTGKEYKTVEKWILPFNQLSWSTRMVDTKGTSTVCWVQCCFSSSHKMVLGHGRAETSLSPHCESLPPLILISGRMVLENGKKSCSHLHFRAINTANICHLSAVYQAWCVSGVLNGKRHLVRQ